MIMLLPSPKVMNTGAYLCYVVVSSKHPQRTYVGITNNFPRRLRQHNGEIVGGARATRMGRPWIPYCLVEGFPNKTSSLQFEWMWKHMAPKKSHGKKARIQKLKTLLHKDRWTTKAPLAKEIPLTVTFYDHVHQNEMDSVVDCNTTLKSWEIDLLSGSVDATNSDDNVLAEPSTVLPEYVRLRYAFMVDDEEFEIGDYPSA